MPTENQSIANLQSDLNKSLTKDLLIDITPKDLQELGTNPDMRVVAIAMNIYKTTKLNDSKKLNTLYLNCESFKSKDYPELPTIVAFLLDKLDDDIKLELNKTIVKNMTIGAVKGLFDTFGGAALKAVTGGWSDTVVSVVAGSIIEQTTSTLDFLIEGAAEKIVNYPVDALLDWTEKQLGELDADIDGNIYLSKEAKDEIVAIATAFKDADSFSKSFELIIRLISAISIKYPKLIIINNPHLLDEISLAIINKYFSVAKNLPSDKRCGVSFVYINQQEDTDGLKAQKLFLQRYNLLERLNSDIPFIAVRQSVFVGRADEKSKLLAQTKSLANDTNQKFLSHIIGNPGIGKTSLYNEHMRDIFDRNVLSKEQRELDGIIRLEIYNEPNRQSTGLASLVSSIHKELSRLELAFATHGSFLDKLGKKAENAHELIPYVKDVKQIGESIIKRLAYKTQSSKDTLKESFSDKPQNQEEEHFNNIRDSLYDLQKISRKVSGEDGASFIIFIDDLQWIDETSCKFVVEYLLNGSWNIHIITTVRREDGKDIYKKLQQQTEQNKYKLKLIESCGIIDNKQSSLPGNVSLLNISLKGFNKNILSELISQTVVAKSEPCDKASIMADAIIEFLDEGENVTTLFAIETINILCDESFYTNHNTDKLIYVGNIQACFSDIPDNEFKTKLSLLLDNLKSSYESSFGDGKGFTLSSHAVLEERLRLIEGYFGEEGPSVVFGIIVSSAVASPFDRDILKSVLDGVANEPALEEINKQFKHIAGLKESHMESIESIYELICKELMSRYRYSHSLLEIFLDSKLGLLLDNVDNSAKEKFYEIVLRAIEKHASKDIFEKHEDGLNQQEMREKIYTLGLRLNSLEKLYHLKPDRWGGDYIISLINLAYSYTRVGKSNEAVKLDEKALEITEELYSKNPDRWAEQYTTSLNNLAYSYKDVGKSNKAIELEEEALEIREKLYLKDSDRWADDYIVSLNNLGDSYKNVGKSDKAIELGKEALKITKELYPKNPDRWAEHYTKSLNNLAVSYKSIGKGEKKAIKLEKKALKITKELYLEDSDRWAGDYIVSLINLAASYKDVGNSDKAIELGKEALEITEELYSKNPDRWARDYTRSLSEIVKIYIAAAYYPKTLDNAHILYDISSRHSIDSNIFAANAIGFVYLQQEDFKSSFDANFEIYRIKVDNIGSKKDIENLIKISVSLLLCAKRLDDMYRYTEIMQQVSTNIKKSLDSEAKNMLFEELYSVYKNNISEDLKYGLEKFEIFNELAERDH